MGFALGCSGSALLLTLALGIEAVAHERLVPCLDRSAGGRGFVAAIATVWRLRRWTYRIGYHIDPLWRGIGVFSMALGLAILFYGVGTFAHAFAGWIGVAALLGPFALIEAYLFLALRRPT